MKNEEYIADFCLVSKRTLSEAEYRVFKYHYLLGADWKLCCRKLNIDRGTFFHAVYRIEQKLGKTFRELEPHALFPLDEYFGGNGRKEVLNNLTIFPIETEPAVPLTPPKKILKFPLLQAA